MIPYFSFVWLIQHVVPLCFMLSWVYPVAMLVQRIVYEKEQRLKEVSKSNEKSNCNFQTALSSLIEVCIVWNTVHAVFVVKPDCLVLMFAFDMHLHEILILNNFNMFNMVLLLKE